MQPNIEPAKLLPRGHPLIIVHTWDHRKHTGHHNTGQSFPEETDTVHLKSFKKAIFESSIPMIFLKISNIVTRNYQAKIENPVFFMRDFTEWKVILAKTNIIDT